MFFLQTVCKSSLECEVARRRAQLADTHFISILYQVAVTAEFTSAHRDLMLVFCINKDRFLSAKFFADKEGEKSCMSCV